MRRTITLFGILAALLVGASAILTTIILRSYDVSRPDIGSGTLDVQKDSYPVVVLGDSLAAGVGASSPEAGVAFQVYTSLSARHANAQLHTFGQSGATTENVLNDQLPRLSLLTNPRVIVLIVGTNDIIQRIPEPVFEKNWKEILDALAQPDRTVVVLNIPKFSTTPAVPDNQKAEADAETTLRNAFITRSITGRTGIKLVDFYQLSSTELQPGSHLLSEDQFHPNDAGYAKISDAVVKAIGE